MLVQKPPLPQHYQQQGQQLLQHIALTITLIADSGKVKDTVSILMLHTCLFIAKNPVVCVTLLHLDVLLQSGKVTTIVMM